VTPQEKKIQNILLAMVASSILGGLSYVEGLAMFRAGVFLMEEIQRNPQIDDDFLATKAAELIKQELAQVQ
jgi:hypothetical protein